MLFFVEINVKKKELTEMAKPVSKRRIKCNKPKFILWRRHVQFIYLT